MARKPVTNQTGDAAQYRRDSRGHRMYTLSVTLLPQHYSIAQWLGYWHFPSHKELPPQDFLRTTGRLNADGSIRNPPDRAFTRELAEGHPLCIALKGLLPNPAWCNPHYLDPVFRTRDTSGESFWFTAQGLRNMRRWENTRYTERLNLPPLTITMLLREESVKHYKLDQLDMPNITVWRRYTGIYWIDRILDML